MLILHGQILRHWPDLHRSTFAKFERKFKENMVPKWLVLFMFMLHIGVYAWGT